MKEKITFSLADISPDRLQELTGTLHRPIAEFALGGDFTNGKVCFFIRTDDEQVICISGEDLRVEIGDTSSVS